eukprot:Sspe_Gene.80155::Locus_50458_Transcript_1_2_Confidence_0.667_Length_486::g.80155::m.80155
MSTAASGVVLGNHMNRTAPSPARRCKGVGGSEGVCVLGKTGEGGDYVRMGASSHNGRGWVAAKVPQSAGEEGRAGWCFWVLWGVCGNAPTPNPLCLSEEHGKEKGGGG